MALETAFELFTSGMNKRWLLAGAIALTGCDSPNSMNDPQELLKPRKFEQEARVGAQRLWRKLIRNAQGCPGRIIRDQDLVKTVVGNRISDWRGVRSHSPNGPIVSRSYYIDGRLESTVQFADPIGRYWIDGQKLCHWNLHGMGDVQWCSRLIRSPDGQLMEELMDDRNPDQVRLGCTPIAIERLANKS